MGRYNIYRCKLNGMPTKLPEIVEKHKIDYHMANESGIKMGELAEKIYHESRSKWTSIPLCHTMEAQAFGSKVKIDYVNGNRIVGYPIERLKDIDKILIPNLHNHKIEMVLESAKYLKDKGLPVAVNVIGPTTLATSILPIEEIYRGMSKGTEDVKNLFSILENFLVSYINEILELDIDLLSYADPTGTLDIIGARLYKMIAGPSYLRVLKNIKLKNNTKIHICPKSSSSLLAVGMIEEDLHGVFWGGNCISKTGDIDKSRKYKILQ